ncbi:MAG: phosphodiesterase [Desulfurivibrio sp.]|nr:MAG: phosphodiesterase [Desulfurivibrio sp.]
MLQPDYNNSIVNLVAAIAKACGGPATGYAPLAGLTGLAPARRPLVLLIVDGLGDVFLGSQPHSFLCRHRRGRLTSVFPPTTASAVTSFFTGVAPQQHAITGWHTWFREVGAVVTILPFRARYGGPCLSRAGISPALLIDHGSLLNSLDVPCHVVLPQQLVGSDYSRVLSGRASRHGYGSLAGMCGLLEKLAAPPQPGLIIAYWPELDSLAHEHGIGSDRVAAHFLELDRACRQTLSLLADRGATVMVSADHGLVDTCREHTIHLADHGELAACLTLPLCGEPRCAYCYVRADRGQEFECYVRERLGHACDLRKSSELIRAGFFGRGTPSPRLAERSGEYILLMKEDYIVRDHLLGEKNYRHIGVHGSLSEQELHVPLIVLP